MTSNPFLSNEPLNPRLHQSVLARKEVIGDVCGRILAGEYCLVLGPKYSGRTTLLKAVDANLRVRSGERSVLIRPTDLVLTDERRFFFSLATLLEKELRMDDSWPSQIQVAQYKISDNADAFNALLNDLANTIAFRLILFFDSIERIPPNVLVRVAHIAHATFQERASRTSLRNLSFNFAGAISLRYLTFYARPEVSPFNVCSDVVLRDLSTNDARAFLDRINDELQLRFRYDAIAAIVEYAGGDLNLLQKMASLSLVAAGDAKEIDRTTVEHVVNSRILQDHGQTEESLRYVGMQVEEDLSTLDLVLRLFRQGTCPYTPSESDSALYDAFQITYPEMAGAVILERPGGEPSNWVFRNKLTHLFLARHFTPQRIVKTYTALAHFEAAVRHCDPLLDLVRKEFEDNVLGFDDSDLKDVVIAFTNRIYAEGSHEFSYKLLANLLSRGFACTTATFYDYIPPEHKLRAVKFLSHVFRNDGTEYDVQSDTQKDVLEIRVFHSKLFGIEAGASDDLRIAIPLKNLKGDVTAVITINSKAQMDRWAPLNIKIQVMERALQAINVALNKVETDSKSHIIDSLKLLKDGHEPIKVFIAHKFNLELLANLRDHLGRVNSFFDFRYIDDQDPIGILFSEIEGQMRQSSLCLYEMSFPNNNVYLELGLGIGLNLPGFLFVRRSKESPIRIPSLLEGVFRFEYMDYKGIIERINRVLESALNRYLLNRSDAEFCHFLGVRVPKREKRGRYIAVLDHDHFGDQRDYREAVESVAAAMNLGVAYPLDADAYPGKFIGDPSQSISRYRLVDVLVVLRNADAVVGRIEAVGDDQIAGQAFIGIGMAFGLELPRVLLTSLSERSDGTELQVPADLHGLTSISYNTFAKLKTNLESKLRS